MLYFPSRTDPPIKEEVNTYMIHVLCDVESTTIFAQLFVITLNTYLPILDN